MPTKIPKGMSGSPTAMSSAGAPDKAQRWSKASKQVYTPPIEWGTSGISSRLFPYEKYRVRLYFQEPWFGKENVGIGGPGSRVFDVWCNGAVLLKNFDILSEGGSRPVAKTFDNVQATAQGKIELTFSPVINYPLINAIEVLPEPGK